MKHTNLVLMLEDDPDDRFLTRSTLAQLNNDIEITFLKSSTELFFYLENYPRPDLIIIDYNSIPENAVQILKELKSDEAIKSIPVIVLSESTSQVYKSECYKHGANSYIQKPSTAEATTYKIDTFFKYWFTTAEV